MVRQPVAIYLFKINSGTTRTMCEIRWKLTSVFNVDFEQILYFFGVDFEQVGNILCKMPINNLKNCLGTSRRTNHFEHWSSLGIPSEKLKIGKTANRFKNEMPSKKWVFSLTKSDVFTEIPRPKKTLWPDNTSWSQSTSGSVERWCLFSSRFHFFAK